MANRWPKEMPVLKPSDFDHGHWAISTSGNFDTGRGFVDGLPPCELDEIGCGTRCCLVGHVRHAFGLPADPESDLGDLPPQGVRFLDYFVTAAGYSRRPSTINPEMYASDCFEGEYDPRTDSYRNQMSKRKAARVWAKTLEHFGYTEDA